MSGASRGNTKSGAWEDLSQDLKSGCEGLWIQEAQVPPQHRGHWRQSSRVPV